MVIDFHTQPHTTGFDPYTPDHEFGTPDRIPEVLEDVAPENLCRTHKTKCPH